MCAITVPLLGDAALFTGDIFRYINLHQPVPLYREPLTMLMNSRVFQLINWLGLSTKSIVAYHVTGALFGALFVATALSIATHLRTSYHVKCLAFVLLMSCGGTLLFFGYVENYAPQYALVALYMALIFRMFREHGSPVLPLLILIVCCLFHLQNVLLIPSYLVALAVRSAAAKGTSNAVGLRVYRYAAIAVPTLLAVYAYFQWRPVAPLDTSENPFIPFFQMGDLHYTLFSPVHLTDLVNEHLLLAPVAIVLLIVLLIGARKYIRWTSPEMITVFIATAGLETFLIGGNLQLGLARDWDVVATVGLMLTFMTILALEQCAHRISIRRRTTVAICVVALAGLVSWVAVNVDDESAVKRYTSLINYYRPDVKPFITRYGYENLRKYYFQQGDWAKELETLSMMLRAFPCHIDLSMLLNTTKAQMLEMGSSAGVVVARELLFVNDSLDDQSLRAELGGVDHTIRLSPPRQYPLSFGDLLVGAAVELYQSYNTWTYIEAQAFGDAMIAHHPKLPYGYELKGWLSLLCNNKHGATEYLREAITRDDQRAHPIVQLALCYDDSSTIDSVIVISQRALNADAGEYDAITLLYSALRGRRLVQEDTLLLHTLENSARVCLASAQERRLDENQIKETKTVLNNTLMALNALRPRLPDGHELKQK